MGRASGMKWAGLFLALLLTLAAVSALDSDSRREREERERERERERETSPFREREWERERQYERRERHGRRRGEGERERELRLEEPREVFRSEGGDIRVWDDIRALEEADVFVGAARLTLRNRGLLLPKYTDSATIAYVEEGEGLVGFLTGYSLGETVRRVRRGDVVAFPRGVAHWWYNSGDEELRILGVAETSGGLTPGECNAFFLVGGRGREQGERRRDRRGGREEEQLGGILHGFRKEFLAEAWNVDESEVEELLDSQREVGIVRAEREIDVRQFPGSERRHHGRGHRRDDDVADAFQGGWRSEREFGQEELIGGFAGDFVYNVREGTPDVRVEDAGYATVVNRFKLPLLQHVGLGLAHGRLERNAIFAPHWSPTGHRIFHVLQGDGHLEIVGNAGQRFLSTQVREGEAYVIPRFHPAGIRAGERGLEYISFYTTDLPYIEALAGKTSVFKNLPDQVEAAAFNIDEERVRQCKKSRSRHAILLPPGGEHRRERRRERDEDEGLGQFLFRYLKDTFF